MRSPSRPIIVISAGPATAGRGRRPAEGAAISLPAAHRNDRIRSMDGAASFPVFDLGRFEAGSPAEKRALGVEIDAICRATGFLAVAGHGAPEATIEAAWAKAEAFFSLPLERKQTAKAPYPGYPYGYLAPETESLA